MKKDVRKMNNVAIYLRKSREEEIETREETLARHERILNDYCVSGGRKARFLNPESG